MAEFKVKTKGGADPHGKPRVYFCCHPDDFDRYFDKICEDVFKTHDPAIYYTEDMREVLDETNITVDLGRMNLFLIPITFRLMNEPCRAMSVDIAYAKENNIPILPFMMEDGIDAVYSLPRNFGERQYLSPFSSDKTGISYENKLENYLKSILISDEMAKRIRKAFDAYIFLSYRKKDRRYADELMRIIHNIPGCRDIAIWYDEFLTPGESFIKNIEKAMSDSRLFALLVTPNLLESGNFVMTEEYPMAKKAEMDILPTEMEKTDRDELFSKFDGISEPVRAEDEKFSEALLSVIKNIIISKNDDDPEHNFLIGLAYLDGIDVEVDVERGVALITMAAEAGFVEAMEKLYEMYRSGNDVALNYAESLKWAERLYDKSIAERGEEQYDSLRYLNDLALAYGNVGEHKKSIELLKKAKELTCRIFGAEHPEALTTLNNLSLAHMSLGEYREAAVLLEKLYDISCRIYGEKHADTLTYISNLAFCYMNIGEVKFAIRLLEGAYSVSHKILGDEHPDTLRIINNLGGAYTNIQEYEKALGLLQVAYKTGCKLLGEKHPNTLMILHNIGGIYNDMGESYKAIEILKPVYESYCSLRLDEHEYALSSLNALAKAYINAAIYAEAVETRKRIHEILCKILGQEDNNSILALCDLAYAYFLAKDYESSYQAYMSAYTLCYMTLGKEHPQSEGILKACKALIKILYKQ